MRIDTIQRKPKPNNTSWLLSCGLFLLPLSSVKAWEPSAAVLQAAIQTGDFSGYFSNVSSWLNTRIQADGKMTSEVTLKAMLKDPAFM